MQEHQHIWNPEMQRPMTENREYQLIKLTRVVELTTVFKSPWLFSSKDPVEDSSVDHATIQAKVVMERWPDVSDRMQLLPHPGLLQVIRILGYMEPCIWIKKIN